MDTAAEFCGGRIHIRQKGKEEDLLGGTAVGVRSIAKQKMWQILMSTVAVSWWD